MMRLYLEGKECTRLNFRFQLFKRLQLKVKYLEVSENFILRAEKWKLLTSFNLQRNKVSERRLSPGQVANYKIGTQTNNNNSIQTKQKPAYQ
jgi:hypothetical protein